MLSARVPGLRGFRSSACFRLSQWAIMFSRSSTFYQINKGSKINLLQIKNNISYISMALDPKTTKKYLVIKRPSTTKFQIRNDPFLCLRNALFGIPISEWNWVLKSKRFNYRNCMRNSEVGMICHSQNRMIFHSENGVIISAPSQSSDTGMNETGQIIPF